MSDEQSTLYEIRGMIASLPEAEREATLELAEHIRRQLASAGEPVATMVVALIGAEAQLKAAS